MRHKFWVLTHKWNIYYWMSRKGINQKLVLCSKPEGCPQNRALRSESYSELPKPTLRAYFSMRLASVHTQVQGFLAWILSLSPEDPLEKEMAAHSRILAWEIPWTKEPDGLQSMGSQKSGTWLSDWTTTTQKKKKTKNLCPWGAHSLLLSLYLLAHPEYSLVWTIDFKTLAPKHTVHTVCDTKQVTSPFSSSISLII